MDIIDPHLHLFNLDQGSYDWLQPESSLDWPDKDKICKNFTESDIELSGNLSLSGFVHIEAGFDNKQPWRELEWLQSHCSLPFRSIAYADMTSENFAEDLERLRGYESLVGIRYILDDRAGQIVNDPVFQENLRLLEKHQLIFEAQFPLEDFLAANAFSGLLKQLPALKVVVNHAGFPSSSQGWMESITALAYHPNCYIKCSGWEMLDREWTAEKVKPYISFIIRQFGLTRVMLASNFPVSELSCSYPDLWQRYLKEMKFKGFEKDLLLHDNAQQFYGFE